MTFIFESFADWTVIIRFDIFTDGAPSLGEGIKGLIIKGLRKKRQGLIIKRPSPNVTKGLTS